MNKETGMLAAAALVLMAPSAIADTDMPTPETWAIHGQATFVDQYHPAFHSAYRGANSLDPGSRGDETVDMTLFAGVSPWQGGEAWANVEMDQGFGLSGTFGVAAFPSAEAYKVGAAEPYGRLHRLFFRQTFDLGGDEQAVEGQANQLAGSHASDNLVITVGKFSVTDIFDNSTYAHDPRGDFLNWAIVDAGAFDYAADAWAYTYGGAAEWSFGDWTLRGGLFDMSRLPNSTELDTDFGQYELVSELERRVSLFGHDGKIKLLGFVNHANMGTFTDALALARATGTTPDVAKVRRFRARPGGTLNVEQGLTDDLGFFLRASENDGSKESFEFTDINESLTTGLSLKGTSWQRKDDTVGFAFEVAGISKDFQAYLAAGGLGVLVGDGQLPRYSNEVVLETYYDAQLIKGVNAALDYQFIANPGYNPDRGPVSVLGLRLHGEF
ncbi:MAG TPA: carbohydrate porin [Rhizomicrobium sp.]|nr:carbohydrate porin [Rhizomicrobium sp.]